MEKWWAETSISTLAEHLEKPELAPFSLTEYQKNEESMMLPLKQHLATTAPSKDLIQEINSNISKHLDQSSKSFFKALKYSPYSKSSWL